MEEMYKLHLTKNEILLLISAICDMDKYDTNRIIDKVELNHSIKLGNEMTSLINKIIHIE